MIRLCPKCKTDTDRNKIGKCMTTKFCMQCQKPVYVIDKDLSEWKPIYNKLGKVTRRICPVCAAGKKKFDSSGQYKQ